MILHPVRFASSGIRVFQYVESNPPPASSTMIGECPGVTWNAILCPARSIMCVVADAEVSASAARSPKKSRNTQSPTTMTDFLIDLGCKAISILWSPQKPYFQIRYYLLYRKL